MTNNLEKKDIFWFRPINTKITSYIRCDFLKSMVGVFLCLHLYRYFTTNLPLDGRVVHLAVAGVLKRVLKTSSRRASSVPASTSMRVSKKEVQEFSYVVRRRPKLLPLEISNFLFLAFKGQQPFSRKASFQDFLVGRKPIWRS